MMKIFHENVVPEKNSVYFPSIFMSWVHFCRLESLGMKSKGKFVSWLFFWKKKPTFRTFEITFFKGGGSRIKSGYRRTTTKTTMGHRPCPAMENEIRLQYAPQARKNRDYGAILTIPPSFFCQKGQKFRACGAPPPHQCLSSGLTIARFYSWTPLNLRSAKTKGFTN